MNKLKKFIGNLQSERGSALILSLMVLTLMLVLGSAALIMTSAESEVNSVQDKRKQYQLAAESAIEETIAHLEQELATKPFYLSDKLNVPVEYKPLYNNSVVEVVYIVYKDNFVYEINTKGIQSKVQGNVVVEEIEAGEGELEIPAAFTKAAYSVGTIVLRGNSEINGPVHGNAIAPGGNSRIYYGPVTYSESSGKPDEKHIVSSLVYQDSVPAPIIDMNYIPTTPTPIKNGTLSPADVGDNSVIRVEGSVTLEGNFSSQSFLVYATGDITIPKGTTFSSDVVLITKKNMTVKCDKIAGILIADGEIEFHGPSEFQGSLVSRAGMKLNVQEIKSEPGKVKKLLEDFPFSKTQSTETVKVLKYSVYGVRIIEWKEN